MRTCPLASMVSEPSLIATFEFTKAIFGTRPQEFCLGGSSTYMDSNLWCNIRASWPQSTYHRNSKHCLKWAQNQRLFFRNYI